MGGALGLGARQAGGGSKATGGWETVQRAAWCGGCAGQRRVGRPRVQSAVCVMRPASSRGMVGACMAPRPETESGGKRCARLPAAHRSPNRSFRPASFEPRLVLRPSGVRDWPASRAPGSEPGPRSLQAEGSRWSGTSCSHEVDTEELTAVSRRASGVPHGRTRLRPTGLRGGDCASSPACAGSVGTAGELARAWGGERGGEHRRCAACARPALDPAAPKCAWLPTPRPAMHPHRPRL